MKTILVSCVLFFMLLSCSADEAQDEEKGSIEKVTDKVATKIVENIQKPIDKARAVKEIEEQRSDQYKKQLE